MWQGFSKAASLGLDGSSSTRSGCNSEGGRPRPRSKASRNAEHSWFPDGPGSLKDVLNVAVGHVGSILDHARSHEPRLENNLRSLAGSDIVLTEAFAGAGTFGLSSRQALEQLQREMNPPSGYCGKVVLWASWDIDVVARKVLLATESAGAASSRVRRYYGSVFRPRAQRVEEPRLL